MQEIRKHRQGYDILWFVNPKALMSVPTVGRWVCGWGALGERVVGSREPGMQYVRVCFWKEVTDSDIHR